MTEEMVETTPKPKQYLMVLDEVNMVILSKVMPSLRFIQVEGMPLKENENYMVLVNPIDKADVQAHELVQHKE